MTGEELCACIQEICEGSMGNQVLIGLPFPAKIAFTVICLLSAWPIGIFGGVRLIESRRNLFKGLLCFSSVLGLFAASGLPWW